MLCLIGADQTWPAPVDVSAMPAVTGSDAATSAQDPQPGVTSKPDERADRAAASDPQKAATVTRATLCDTASLVAEINNLPVPFFTRLIQQESGFNPRVVSRAGAQGIAQFMPKTASFRRLDDPFEPIQALAASGQYLADLVSQFGNLGLAAAAYNAGPKRVADWLAKRRPLPAETRHYVYSITGHAAEAWTPGQAGPSPLTLAAPENCSGGSGEEVQALPARIAQARISVPDQHSTKSAAERHALPRPSQFIVGRPVPAAIRATEAKVLAKLKWQPGSNQTRHGNARLASVR